MDEAIKILIAEHDSTNRLSLRSALVRLGDNIEVATQGDAAWVILQHADAPEIAIVDWAMPAMNGPDICRKLRGRVEWYRDQDAFSMERGHCGVPRK